MKWVSKLEQDEVNFSMEINLTGITNNNID